MFISSRSCYGAGGLSASLLMLLSSHAHAAEFTANAGSLLRQNAGLAAPNGGEKPASTDDAVVTEAPSATAAGDVAFPVRDIQIDGELSERERRHVEALVAPLRGQELTMSALQVLRGTMTLALYQDSGNPVSVLLPPQTVSDGVVRFQIVRGHIESVRVVNASQVSDEVIANVFATRLKSLQDIERGIALVRQFPGVGTATATLSLGTEQGGTIVSVRVTPSQRFHAAVMVDNAGSNHAGTQRLGVQMGIDNPFGHGDHLDMLAIGTPTAMQSTAEKGGQTRVARVSYDTLVDNRGTRVGAAYSQVGYRLGGVFDGLGKGNAQVQSLYASTPLARTASNDLDLTASVEHKNLDDFRFGDLLESRRSGDSASLGITGDATRALRSLDMSLHYNLGVRSGDIAARDIDRSVEPEDIDSRQRRYAKLEAGMDTSARLGAGWIATANAQGQWASRSLDGSERLTLGGPGAVRAYDQDVAAVDSGGVASLGASYRLPGVPGVSMDAFYDYGRGVLRADAMVRPEGITLQGAGVGLSWQRPGINAQASYAVPVGRTPVGAQSGQLWFTMRVSY